ncbi:polyadenylate-binding protein RBP47A [Citrus sinensis]|nr:polyadenylate-binding protein RBP47A [Citrus sinensis]
MVCIVQVGPKKASGYQQQYSSQALVLAGGPASNGARVQGSDGESNNATIFVGALDSNVSDKDLRELFSHFGEILSVKIPVGKGCGFVQFANRKDAEQTVRLSWGHNPRNKQWRGDHINHWNRAHYGGQGYSGNGYAFPPNQDPNMYAATTVPGAS